MKYRNIMLSVPIWIFRGITYEIKGIKKIKDIQQV